MARSAVSALASGVRDLDEDHLGLHERVTQHRFVLAEA